MSDFNIRKFLNESYADEQEAEYGKSQEAELAAFNSQPQSITCPSCDGTGYEWQLKTKPGETPEECPACGGKGEMFEDGTGLTQAQEIAQDMIDGGMIATSLNNFYELFTKYVQEHYKFSNRGFGILKADTLIAYRRILNKYHDNRLGESTDIFDLALTELKNQAGITEDKDTRSPAEKKAYAYKMGQKDAKDNKGADMSKLKTHWGPTGDDYKAGYADGSKEFNEATRSMRAHGRTINDVPADVVAGIKAHDSSVTDDAIIEWYYSALEFDQEISPEEFMDWIQYDEEGNFKETSPQGAAPAAQVKGNEDVPDTSGVRGYDQPHKMSGRLVGEDNEFSDDWGDNQWMIVGTDEWTGFEIWNNGGTEFEVTEDGGVIDSFTVKPETLDLASPKMIAKGWFKRNLKTPVTEAGSDFEDGEEEKERIFRRVMGWEDEISMGPVDAAQQLAKDRSVDNSLEEELLGQYIDEDYDDEEFEDHEDDRDDEDEYDTSVTIGGKLPHESYWNHRGTHQDKIEPLEALLPAIGEVEDLENNPMLERFREGANIYYDVYNNGFWDEGKGQRGEEFEQLFDLGPGQNIDTDDLEELIDETVIDAWKEQLAKGTINEEFLHEDDDDFKDEEDIANDEDGFIQDNVRGGYDASCEGKFLGNFDDSDDAFKAIKSHCGSNYFPTIWSVDDHGGMSLYNESMIQEVEMDTGDELVVEPGQLVQVGDELGGEATVVAQRSGYIVVNLPKGGMKLLRDDEWWVNDSEEFGTSDEEPAELAFEAGTGVMGPHSQDDRQNILLSRIGEGYSVLPPMDPKYVEREGLEGPFRARNGKVYYYDPQEGKNYDPDTDFYMSDEEWFAHDRDPNMEYVKYSAPERPSPPPRERGRMDEEVTGSTTFGANYSDDYKYTDLHAPSPGNSVMTVDGEGVVLDSWQNNAGYYTFFKVELLDPANEKIKDYHISAVKYIDHSRRSDDRLGEDGYRDTEWLNKQSAKKQNWKLRGIELPGKFRSRYDRIPIDSDPKTAEKIKESGSDAFKRHEMDQEIGHERSMNNFQISVDGELWKVVRKKNHAAAIVDNLLRQGKDAYYDETMAPVSEDIQVTEGKWDYDQASKGKGAGWSAEGDGGAKNRKQRKAFRKAEKKRKHQAMMRGEKWAQEEMPEAIVPTTPGKHIDDDGTEFKYLDNETGELMKIHPDEQAKLDSIAAEKEALQRGYEDEFDGSWTDEDEAELADFERGPDQLRKLEWDALSDFGDVAGAGGDPIDAVMVKYGFNMEEIDAAAVEQGYADAGQWADSFTGEKNFSEGGSGSIRTASNKSHKKHQAQLKKAKAWQIRTNSSAEAARKKFDLFPNDLKEGHGTFKKGPKNKGGGYNKPGSVAQKKASSKAGRKGHASSYTYKDDYDDYNDDDEKGWDSPVDESDFKPHVESDAGLSWRAKAKKWGLNVNKFTPHKVANKILLLTGGDYDEDNLDAELEVIMKTLVPGELANRIWFVWTDDGFQNELRKHLARMGPDSPVNEIETATDELNADRELGEPTVSGIDPEGDAELAGMQQIIKNMMQEPDQDMSDAIQDIADPEDQPVDQQLGTDELGQLKQLLKLLK